MTIGSMYKQLARDHCSGQLKVTKDGISIDCSECEGPMRLEERRCFMGVADRLYPGFSGEVLLRGNIDRSYAGPLIDTLVSSSEILDLFQGIYERADRELLMPWQRMSVRKGLDKGYSSFLEDPGDFLRSSMRYRNDLSRAWGKGKDIPLSIFDDAVERTSLLMRRLGRN